MHICLHHWDPRSIEEIASRGPFAALAQQFNGQINAVRVVVLKDMSRYRAIVFDLDGTAVPNVKGGMPSAELVQIIKDVPADLHLIAATGRPPEMALPILRALGLTDPCITSGGATIISPLSGEVIQKVTFSEDQLTAILAVGEGRTFDVEIEGTYVIDDNPALLSARLSGVSIVAFSPIPDRDLPDVLSSLNSIDGVLAVSTSYWKSDHAVHVTPVGGSKEHGINFVLDRLGVQASEAVGVGDGDNDLHLFASVGYRIAMGNASDALKAAANEVVSSIEHDGLVDVIDRCAKQHLSGYG